MNVLSLEIEREIVNASREQGDGWTKEGYFFDVTKRKMDSTLGWEKELLGEVLLAFGIKMDDLEITSDNELIVPLLGSFRKENDLAEFERLIDPTLGGQILKICGMSEDTNYSHYKIRIIKWW